MKRFLTLVAVSIALSLTAGCSNDDDATAPVACPSPGHLNGLVQQLQAIQAEINVLQTQLPNAQGTDRDAILDKINKANERGSELDKELEKYQHCF